MDKLLKIFLVSSTILYGAAFVYLLVFPQQVEQDARGFIKRQIAKKTHETIDNIDTKYKENKLVKFAGSVLNKQKKRLRAYKKALKHKADEKLSIVMAKMLDLDCKCRQKYQKAFHTFLLSKITDLKIATQKLEAFMTREYMLVVNKVIRDVRIFTGSSFLVLLILMFLLFRKPKVGSQVTILTGAMLTSTLVSSYVYLFDQNWFYTIIYNDYVGFAYLLYLGIIFLVLLDIIFNDALIIDGIASGVGHAIGSVVPGASC